MNTTQILILSWIPRLTSTLSALGSLSIIYMILSDRDRKLTKTNHRLMLSLSIFDCLGSLAYSLTTLALPSEPDVYGTMGNFATCAAQGFFLQLGLAVPLYNASLGLFYLFTIRYRMHPTKFSKTIEPFLHTISVLPSLTIAIIAVSKGIIVPFETVCALSLNDPTGQILGWIQTGLVSSSGLTCIWTMVSICSFVIRQSRRMMKYSYGSSQLRRRNTETRDTVLQALLYTSAFFSTYLFPGISLTLAERSFSLEVLIKIFYPLQGFWNFLLYIRPGIDQVREESPGKNFIGILIQVIFHVKERNTQRNRRSRKRRSIQTNGREVVGAKDTRSTPDDQKYHKHEIEAEAVDSGLKYEASMEELTSDNISLGKEKGVSRCTNFIGKVGQISSKNNNNIPHMSPLYMEDRHMGNSGYKNPEHISMELNLCSTQRVEGLQWNELEKTSDLNQHNKGDQPFTFISDKGSLEEKEDKVFALEIGRRNSDSENITRRVSLLSLATIESHYSQDDLDELESTESIISC